MIGGYAVRKDGQGWRAVDGPEPNPEFPLMVTPDYETETYSAELPPDPVPLPPTAEEMLVSASAERDQRLSIAAIRIAPLQDAVDLEEATPDDAAILKKWKQYRVDVNRVPDQTGFPSSIEWPVAPTN